ncbi:MAG: FAD-binding oxidoreductase [Alphaproteobacteria bacterium]
MTGTGPANGQGDEALHQRFLPLSAYMTAPADPCPPLSTDIVTDAVVIGGGWTGLHAALSLREKGMDVALVEQFHCGYGGSGRSGGHLVGPGKEMRRFFKNPDSDAARQYARYIARVVDIAEAKLSAYGIEADYIPSGNLFGATHPKMLQETAALAQAAQRAGFEVEHWDERDCRTRELPTAWLGGMYCPRGGTLNPGKYVLGLRDAAKRAGVKLFENTPVTAIEDGQPATLRTPEGSVRANRVIIAAGTFTPTTLKRLTNRVATFRIGAFETAPLSEFQRDRLGWPNREGLVSMHNVIEAYRLTAQGTIVANTKRIFATFGNRPRTRYEPGIFEPMVRGFRDRFPELRDVAVESLWAGWCGLTPDMFPRIEVAGKHGNILSGIGFNGHGVAPTAAMGETLACLAAGEDHPHLALLQRRTMPWPPEPIRWLAVSTFLRWLDFGDAITDRQLRRRAGQG